MSSISKPGLKLPSSISKLVFVLPEVAQSQIAPAASLAAPAPKLIILPMVEVADVCGAGDTFLASLVYSYLDAKDMRTAIRFAIKAAGVSVQHIGCYAPRLEELI
jgi:sugar/nucleoside kinase (ribokinase family)